MPEKNDWVWETLAWIKSVEVIEVAIFFAVEAPKDVDVIFVYNWKGKNI